MKQAYALCQGHINHVRWSNMICHKSIPPTKSLILYNVIPSDENLHTRGESYSLLNVLYVFSTRNPFLICILIVALWRKYGTGLLIALIFILALLELRIVGR